MIDFCIDLLPILAPFWEPSWGHVGHLFGKNGGTGIGGTDFFVGSMLFFVPSPGAMGYPALVFILGGFWVYVGPLAARALDGLVGVREAKGMLNL